MAVGGSGWRRRRRLEEDGGDWDDDELLGYIGLEEDGHGGLLGYMSTYKILFDLSCFTSYASGKEGMFPDPISNQWAYFSSALPLFYWDMCVLLSFTAVRLTISFNRKLKASVVSLFLSFALTPGSEAYSRLVAYLPK
nr:probable 26S proteasome non-ATPase regulatory subunit 3 [Tanacetum cinerariifolium]